MYKHILLPTDGSELAQRAVAHGIQLAKAIGAKVTIMTAVPPVSLGVTYPMLPGLSARAPVMLEEQVAKYQAQGEEEAGRLLTWASKAAEAAGVAFNTVQTRDDRPYEGIISAAKNGGCDLIVIASHGRRGMSAVLLGSETTKLLTYSTIPVLVVR